MMNDATTILKRHPKNPLITPRDIKGAMAVFNPSPVDYNGKTVLVLSVYKFQHYSGTRGGYVAMSDDGVQFDIRQEPLINLSHSPKPFDKLGQDIIDSRVTKIDGTYYFLTPVMLRGEEEGPLLLLGKTEDFEKYEPLELVGTPTNRGASLFPEKIGGKYYRLDRPGHRDDPASIWISSSPDLIHWGCCRLLLKPGYAVWNRMKIGPTPPIRTFEGWLVIVHGVFSWTGADLSYYIGAILLDLEDPTRIIGKTQSWLLAPEEPYETSGMVDNVVFPCGAIADIKDDQLRIYYGAADTCIGLASGPLSAVIEACKRQI